MLASAVETIRSFLNRGLKKSEDFSTTATLPEFACPVCDQPMLLRGVQRIEQFALKDVRLHALKCETCGMVADRVYHPSIGYDRNFII